MTRETRRRRFIRYTALATTAGLAGCSGGSDSDDDGGATTSDTPEQTETETAAPETEEVDLTESGDESTPIANPERAVEDWLSGTPNFDGHIESETGTTTVDVGARTPNNDYFAYSPPALEVTVGTEVQWQWTGQGGAHSVTERNGAFDSGSPRSSSGKTLTHEFEETGVYLYRCRNHGGAVGMRGAVIVRERDTLSGYPAVDDWLEDYEYDGRLADRRGEASLEVTVGAEGNGGNFAYRPIAPLVSQGTDITFRWTGRGGGHDVTWENVDLPDSDTTSSYDNTFSVTLDESGVYLYRCDNHRTTGGRGAIVVA
ncbi:halocyanin domain-containing protein [Halorientalis litorea]|jgi:halocyanin-like protein|uniref:halocyanin domain-containing protein n=1 Tax=Halorientalis litorea TaxID=2931977 RepID=UPI001FF26006|nr:halocyanin domain-containing protein [Halorientalis litorea]